jgi:uncharacterized protein (TIGR00156 family)
MKGVIVQVGEPKSIVLFNNGKIRAIPTPADCRVGMVVTVKLNNKLKIIAVTFAAAFLVALGVFIGKTLNESKPAIVRVMPPAAPIAAPVPRMMPGPSMMQEQRGRRGRQTQTVTVDEAKNLPDDTIVVLTGIITESFGDDKYTFRDPTGEITVEIDRKIWRGLSLGETDIVEISGEVDVERGKVTVDVKSMTKK